MLQTNQGRVICGVCCALRLVLLCGWEGGGRGGLLVRLGRGVRAAVLPVARVRRRRGGGVGEGLGRLERRDRLHELLVLKRTVGGGQLSRQTKQEREGRSKEEGGKDAAAAIGIC